MSALTCWILIRLVLKPEYSGNSMPMAPCVGRHDVYYIMMPWKRGKFSPTSSQNTPHCSSARAMYVMYFVSSNCYLYFAPVTAVTNAISCYLGQRYNGIWLYIIGQMSHIFYEKVFQSPVSRQPQWNYDMFHSVVFSVRQWITIKIYLKNLTYFTWQLCHTPPERFS